MNSNHTDGQWESRHFLAAGLLIVALLGLHTVATGEASTPTSGPAPNPTLSSLPANTALDLGPYTGGGQVPECYDPRAITDYSRFTYDPIHHQMLLFGGGHASTPRTDVDVFNPDTLAWTSAYPSQANFAAANLDPSRAAWKESGHPLARHTYDLLPFAANTGELILMTGTDGKAACAPGDDVTYWSMTSKIAHYNPVTRTWSWTSVSVPFQPALTAEYDPVSGMIIHMGSAGFDDIGWSLSLFTYDPVNRVYQRRLDLPPEDMSYAQNLVYFPPTDKMYYIVGDGRVWEITLNRSDWSRTKIEPIPVSGTRPNAPETGWAYDAANRIIGGGITNGVFYAFDPLTRTWTSRAIQVQSSSGAVPRYVAFHALDYDPVNQVFLFLGTSGVDGPAERTWAYRFGSPAATPPPSETTTSSTPDTTTSDGGTGSTGSVSGSGTVPADDGVSSSGGGGLPMPSLQDERDAYASWGWTWSSGAEPNFPGDPTYIVSDPDIHGDTEGDDLWTYVIMYRRTGQRGYLDRATAWADYFKSRYRSCAGSSDYTFCYDRDEYGMDHMYGWGLVAWYELTGDAAALAEAENLAAVVEAYWGTGETGNGPVPGEFPMAYYGPRQAARHLLLAVRVAGATGNARWITLRDRLLELWMRSPDWDVRGMYFVGDWTTDYILGNGAYSAGARIQSAFEIGVLSEALYHAWRATGRTDVRDRLVAMARYIDVNGLESTYQYTGSWYGFVRGEAWHNELSASPPSADPVYTTSQVNTLVMGYKFTGDRRLYQRAVYFFNRGTKGVYGSATERAAGDAEVHHFVDTVFDSSHNNFYLAYNKGELQYTYLIFENGGSPAVESMPNPPPAVLPGTGEAEKEETPPAPEATASDSGTSSTADQTTATSPSSTGAEAPPSGRAPHPTLSALPANTALDLGPYTGGGQVPECYDPRAITDYSRFTYDPIHHQMLLFGGGHASTPRTDVDVFNPDTLAWTSAYPSQANFAAANLDPSRAAWKESGHPLARHTYDLLPFAANTGELILMTGTDGKAACAPGDDVTYWSMTSKIAHYNPVTRTWSWTSVSVPFQPALTAEYDPVSGMIIHMGSAGFDDIGWSLSLFTYDPVNRVYQRRLDLPPEDMSYAQNLVYFPPTDKMYYIVGDGRVWEITLNRSDWSRTKIEPIPVSGTRPNAPETGWAYDAANRIIGGGITNGVFYAFDPLTRTWTSRAIQVQSSSGAVPRYVAFHALDYDPVNQVFLFLGTSGVDGPAERTWAYRFGSPAATPPPSESPSSPASLATSAGAALPGVEKAVVKEEEQKAEKKGKKKAKKTAKKAEKSKKKAKKKK
jgi:hypothetical protein